MLEKNGKKLLFDPGTYAFNDSVRPEQFSNVNLILITHEHADHCSLDAIKTIVKGGAKIIANSSVVAKLKEQGLVAKVIDIGQKIDFEGFSIEAFDCPHGELPIPVPKNTGFLIDGNIFNPGDSLEPKNMKTTPEVLLVPIGGPFLKLVDAIAFAKKISPRIAIPVHDGVLKYPAFPIDIFKKALTEAGITAVEDIEI